MNTRWRFIGVGLAVLSLVGVMTAYGWSGSGHGGHRFGHRGAGFPFHVLRALDLTTEQKTQIHTIMESHKATFEKIHTDMRSVRNEIANKFLTPGSLTTQDLTSQADRMAALAAQEGKERLAVGVEVRNVLKPEQLAKAADIMTKMRALRDEMKGSGESD